MNATVIDGKKLAASIREDLSRDVKLITAKGIIPALAVILLGEDPASISYVTGKEKACAELGMKSYDYRLSEKTSEGELLALIDSCNKNPLIHGILVQLPLPSHINEQKVIAAISVEKDVDGFTPQNVGRMVLGEEAYIPCTPHGVVKLIQAAGVKTQGAHVVVVGRSNIVGKPLMNLLVRKELNATVTICHTGTKDLSVFTKQADILIACAGKSGLITKDMVKEGACVIDVGVNRIKDATHPKGYRLVGDVDFEGVGSVAGSITPVPGGVGPMTITMLLYNTVASARKTIR